eukprot:2366702-Prymnesium_polylepis.1
MWNTSADATLKTGALRVPQTCCVMMVRVWRPENAALPHDDTLLPALVVSGQLGQHRDAARRDPRRPRPADHQLQRGKQRQRHQRVRQQGQHAKVPQRRGSKWRHSAERFARSPPGE